jgi:amino acid adenylation domain-containing protein
MGRLRLIIEDAEASAVLGPAANLVRLRRWSEEAPYAARVRWLASEEIPGEAGDDWRAPQLGPDSIAFLQYTSGSTSDPKGVAVSHGALAANERRIQKGFNQSEESVVVGWLPLNHDMGLIGNVLQTLFSGGQCILMSPGAFLQQPVRWLRAISRYRATTSGGPNFAYDLCCRRIPPELREGLDLSSWEVAFNGAEPVRAETLEEFVRTFEPYGFRAAALRPCYGLAESTLLVTLAAPGERLSRAFAAAPLEKGLAVEAEEGGRRRLVSAGTGFDDQRLVIADPETGAELSPGQVGEIWLASPSIAQGYWRKPEVNAEVFAARLRDGGGPFLRTGDLGFVHAGQLFITGRRKDLIIIRGRNHYPQDIERTAEASHPSLRSGSGAAFSLEQDGEERLLIVHEVQRGEAFDVEAITEALRRAVAEEHEIHLQELVLVRHGTLPKTTSGKLRRGATRQAYLEGRLTEVARSGAVRRPAEAAPPASFSWLHRQAAEVLRVAPEAVDPEAPLPALGLDSLSAFELQGAVERELGVTVDAGALLAGVSVRALGEQLAALRDSALQRRPEEGAAEPSPARPAVPVGAEFPLSYGQQGLWLFQQMSPESGAYHLAGAVRIAAAVDETALRAVLAEVLERHAVLRSTFLAVEGEPRQRVGTVEQALAGFRSEDAEGWSEAALADALAREAAQPFDLARGPVLRTVLYRLAPEASLLLLVVHHIAADFRSLAILLDEVAALLAARRDGRPALLPALALALPLSYGEHAERQRRELAGPAGAALQAYWEAELAGDLPRLQLPADNPRRGERTFRGGTVHTELAPALAERVRGLAQREGVTLYTALTAAFALLLLRLGGQSEVLVGAPVEGRTRPDLAGLIGHFATPVVLRTRRPPALQSGAGLLRTAQRTVLAALDHRAFPLELLAERLPSLRGGQPAALFDALFVLHRERGAASRIVAALAVGEAGVAAELSSLRCASCAVANAASPFGLALAMAEVDGRLLASWQFADDLLDGVTVRRMAAGFAALLGGLAADLGAPVSALPLLTAGERAQTLIEWNDTAVPPAGALLHRLFEAQAARSPEAVALVVGDLRLSYRQLAEKASRMAHRLRRHGVAAEARVGVLLGRSADLVPALLGILQAGGAYVPLDPSYPADRLAFMAADAGLAAVVCGEGAEGLRGRLAADVPWISAGSDEAEGAAAPAEAPVDPDNLAYLIYTSGSTGRPKGVSITHRSAAALVLWAQKAFAPRERAAVLGATSISFDLSVFEIFFPLSCGGTVVLARDTLALPELPAAGEVTLVNTVPSAMAELLRGTGLPPSVRTVNLAGEPLPGALVERLYAETGVERVVNLYGPSEDTTYSTVAIVPRGGRREPSIGRPIDGTRAYLLDAELQPVPLGATGELCLAGAGLARGYWGRPELTAERFIPDAWSGEPGGRLYRTGDLARYLPQGDLDFLGRRDDQVKVRGFRIELAEITAVLREHPGIAAAAVTAGRSPAGDAVLVAYVVPGEEPGPGRDELTAWLAARLPAYMLPSAFVPLAALPLSPNGKLDRSRLPAPRFGSEAGEAGTAPRTPVEELLAALWCDVLGLAAVRRDDDFFALGGHSLTAARLAARIEAAFGRPFALRAALAAPTLAGMARAIEAARPSPSALPPLAAPEPGERVPLSPAQHGLWQFERLYPGTAVYNMPAAIDLEGDLDAAALGRALDLLLARHEVLRTAFPVAAGQPWQRVSPAAAQPLPRIDLSALPEPVRGRAAADLAAGEARRPFDLQAGPLLRTVLLRTGPAAHTLLLTAHHTVADGGSIEVFLRELAVSYGAFAAGRAPELPPLPVQYGGYSLAQQRLLRGGAADAALAYWRERLAGAAPLDLPSDRPQPPAGDRRGEVVRLPAAGLGGALAALGRQQGASPLMVLLAGFQALLGRFTGQTDIVVGLPFATRDRPELEALIGLFVHVLPVRSSLRLDGGFAELLAAVREEVLGAYEHRALPFQELIERLDLPAGARGGLDLRAVLDLETAPAAVDLPGLRLAVRKLATGTAKFDLSIGLRSGLGGDEEVVCELRSALFDPPTVERLVHHLGVLLTAAADPRTALGGLPLLTAAEREQMLNGWGAGEAVDTAGLVPVHRLFEQQAAERPWAPAVVAGDRSLTYGELDRAAARLARRLRALCVGAESVVALVLDRSPEVLIGILGVLKAGGAYLPLDAAAPPQRLRSLLVGSGARVVLARGGDGRLGDVPGVVRVDPGAPATVDEQEKNQDITATLPGHLAYLIYTSGSTGVPKAVAVEHASLANLAAWHRRRFAVTPEDRATQLAGLSFDASVWEVWPYLTAGACLYLPDDDTLSSAARLVEWLEHDEMTLCFLPTPVLEAVLPHLGGRAPALRSLLTGGDRLLQRPPAGLSCTLVNQYGPTECTVVATSCIVPPGEPGASPPLGSPIDNLFLRLLDGRGEPVPVGVAGEIHLGGAGLARGYLGRPDLTADRFRPDPFGPAGARLYRTGDLARYRRNGDLEFLGRADHQVKIRGVRIETGEIEASLAAHPAVLAGVVTPQADRGGSLRLVAHVVPRPDATVTAADLFAFLGERLPAVMVPAAIVFLDALPLTRHGKIDRAALPAPASFESGRRQPFVAPRSAFEEILADIWRELLEVDAVGVHDSFFELGGHSLQILRLLARVQELFGVEVQVSRLGRELTIERLAFEIATELAQAADQDTLAQALVDL